MGYAREIREDEGDLHQTMLYDEDGRTLIQNHHDPFGAVFSRVFYAYTGAQDYVGDDWDLMFDGSLEDYMLPGYDAAGNLIRYGVQAMLGRNVLHTTNYAYHYTRDHDYNDTMHRSSLIQHVQDGRRIYFNGRQYIVRVISPHAGPARTLDDITGQAHAELVRYLTTGVRRSNDGSSGNEYEVFTTYDGWGNGAVVIGDSEAEDRAFLHNHNGQVVMQYRQEGAAVQSYHYAGTTPLGSYTDHLDADFDYNFTPVMFRPPFRGQPPQNQTVTM